MTKSIAKIEVGQVREYSGKLYKVIGICMGFVTVEWLSGSYKNNKIATYTETSVLGDRVISDLEQELL